MSSAAAAAPAAEVQQPQRAIPEGFEEIREGKASILYEKGKVFYNPAQVQNRDLSVAVIRTFANIWKKEKQEQREKKLAKQAAAAAAAAAEGGAKPQPEKKKKKKKNDDDEDNDENDDENSDQQQQQQKETITILEALSATGLRTIRYAHEIPQCEYILANDIDEKAVKAIERNRQHNNISEDKVRTHRADASMLLHECRSKNERFDVIDLDPYGTAAPFLDGAVQAVSEGGLLCITCTDMAVLCGASTEACYCKYGSIPLRGKHCHEFALRILLNSIESHAVRYKRYIVPVLSVHMDFYVRVFVRVFSSALKIKHSMAKKANVYQCVECHAHYFQPLGRVIQEGNSTKYSAARGPPVGTCCDICGGKFQIGGPIWLPAMHDEAFVRQVKAEVESDGATFAAQKRLTGLLQTVIDELPDQPLLYDVSQLASFVRTTAIPAKIFRSALMNAGYRQSLCHVEAGGVKTDAPPTVIWDIVRAWTTTNKAHCKPDSFGAKILAKPPTIEVDFTVRQDVSRQKSRFLPTLEQGWGPMQRAGKTNANETVASALVSKRLKNQGRRKRARPNDKEEDEQDGEDEAMEGENEKPAAAAEVEASSESRKD